MPTSGDNLVYQLVTRVNPGQVDKGRYLRFACGKTVAFVCHDEADEAKLAAAILKGLNVDADPG